MISPYHDGYVRAYQRSRFEVERDHSVVDEVVLRRGVRFRVGLSLVSLGTHLMGADRSHDGSPVAPAA